MYHSFNSTLDKFSSYNVWHSNMFNFIRDINKDAPTIYIIQMRRRAVHGGESTDSTERLPYLPNLS